MSTKSSMRLNSIGSLRSNIRLRKRSRSASSNNPSKKSITPAMLSLVSRFFAWVAMKYANCAALGGYAVYVSLSMVNSMGCASSNTPVLVVFFVLKCRFVICVLSLHTD
jgi:hypothetical protein